MAQIEHRRSERVLIDVPVVICGQSADYREFREETFTVTVSAHGALLMLAANVLLGQKLVIMNPKNHDERQVRVAFRGAAHAGLAQVGIEFPRPAPEFWQIDAPPQNWKNC